MNIALFSDTYPPEINGVATSTFSLAKILNERGHTCIVVTTNPFSNKVEFKDLVLRIPGLELKKLYGYRLAHIFHPKALRIIKSFKLDVIHIQTELSIGLFGKAVARLLRLPYVYTYHTMYEDYTYYVTKGHMDFLAKQIVRSYSKGQAEAPTEFISPSEKTKASMRTYGVERYINVVPTGIDFSRFKKEKVDLEKLQAFRAQHGFDKAYTLISLGRVAKEKSIDFLLRGYAKLLKDPHVGPTKFMIVGGGPALDELKQLTKTLGISDNVVFIGPVLPDAVPFYYHAGDLFVSASITETQGLTFMEAMAADKLLCARYDANLADVIIDGETGYFFDSEEAFGEKIKLLIKMDEVKKQQMTEAAKKLVEKYSLDQFYLNIMEVYRRAIRRYF